jgi:hypothetical protein
MCWLIGSALLGSINKVTELKQRLDLPGLNPLRKTFFKGGLKQ